MASAKGGAMPACTYTQTLEAYANLEHAAKRRSVGQLDALQAHLGRDDLFYLLTRLLDRNDLNDAWHFARCREVQAEPDGRLDLWAREHGKSSIVTFGQTVRDILNSPEITVGIFSHTRPVAKDFLRQIKHEFEHNIRLKRLYPDVLWADPKKESPSWSLDKGITVRRKENPKEATVEAWGLVDGQPTGKHFSLLVYDDVVTRESVTTPEMIAKVTEAWALSLNLGAGEGRRRIIGTRYHYNDTYRTILDRKAAVPRIHPATLDGTETGRPALLSAKLLADKRAAMGAHVFGCQMLLTPNADKSMGFQEKHLRFWTPAHGPFGGAAHLNRYIVVDPAAGRGDRGDYTVMLVVGLGVDGNRYLIDGVRDRLNLAARAEALFRLHRLYRPIAVGYEQYGIQADIEYIEAERDRRNYRFDLTPLGGSMPKRERILALGPYFERGQIYLPARRPFLAVDGETRDLTRLFTDEYLEFPVGRHDDMLDCLARILDPKFGAEFPSADVQSHHHNAETSYRFFGDPYAR